LQELGHIVSRDGALGGVENARIARLLRDEDGAGAVGIHHQTNNGFVSVLSRQPFEPVGVNVPIVFGRQQ